ncbi:hypothetical protein [Modestobacter marinus]|uniref:hypothetical protein n=1 Tax=Modestobacter marinus TaxID=477641 RepID=UPI001C93D2EA|nr:hypothetical protein [Modestobacter marinus]
MRLRGASCWSGPGRRGRLGPGGRTRHGRRRDAGGRQEPAGVARPWPRPRSRRAGRPGAARRRRATLRLLAAPLGELVADQLDGLVPALVAAGAGTPVDATTEAALRGLGLLVSEPAAETSVTDRGGEVAGAYVAVQEFGDRIRYSLEYARALSDATDWHRLWTLVTAPGHLVRGPAEDLVDGLLDAAGTGLHADGEARLPPDTGRVRVADDAVGFLRRARHPGGTTGGAETAARGGGMCGLERAADPPRASRARPPRRDRQGGAAVGAAASPDRVLQMMILY